MKPEIITDAQITNNTTQIGWECPLCGRIINPNEKSCPYCDAKHNEGSDKLPQTEIICD